METRPATLKARIFHSLGWSARIPKPTGPHLVRSFHFRIPGEHGVLSQVFFPVELLEHPQHEIKANVPPNTGPNNNGGSFNGDNNTSVVKRAYRNGVIKGFSYFSSTPRWLFDLFLGASPHPLADVPETARPIVHEEGEHSMPWVLFSHGLGGNCEVYTKCCSDMASHGFVVIALEHEDGSGSFAKAVNGDIVRYQRPPQGMTYTREAVIQFRAPFLKKREQEIRRAVEFFTSPSDIVDQYQHSNVDLYHCLQSIHPDKVFLAGHSFGGASTVHTVRSWPGRFRGAILMDIWSYPLPDLGAGIKDVPVCSVLSAPFESNGESYLTWKLLRNSKDVRCNLFVPGSVHSSFSDTPWWTPSWMALKFHLRGALDPCLVQKSLNNVYVTFMNDVLLGDSSAITTSDGAPTESLEDGLLRTDELLRKFSKPSEYN